MKVATLAPSGHAAPVEVVVPTPRERSILRLVRAGHSVKQMAKELDLSTNTLHQYVVQICRTLGLTTRNELQAWAEQHPDCLLPGHPVERRFHRPTELPDPPDAYCPCTWCASLRLGLE
jgi:DNA-binding CsgD family transcriptional regulator